MGGVVLRVLGQPPVENKPKYKLAQSAMEDRPAYSFFQKLLILLKEFMQVDLKDFSAMLSDPTRTKQTDQRCLKVPQGIFVAVDKSVDAQLSTKDGRLRTRTYSPNKDNHDIESHQIKESSQCQTAKRSCKGKSTSPMKKQSIAHKENRQYHGYTQSRARPVDSVLGLLDNGLQSQALRDQNDNHRQLDRAEETRAQGTLPSEPGAFSILSSQEDTSLVKHLPVSPIQPAAMDTSMCRMSQQPNPFFGEQTQITTKRSSRVNRTNDLDFLIKQKYQEKSRERSINDTLRRSNEAGGKPEEDAD